MLGTRGVPAAHGGFETAVENIGLRLVERGWRVVVYCQDDEAGADRREDTWRGIERIHLPSRYDGAKGTIWFDQQAVRDAARHRDLCLTMGYNTAFLNALLRARRIRNVVNMDGIEWKRGKWSRPKKTFLYANERLGCLLGNHLIADHPEIERHLATRVSGAKITMIPYGAPALRDSGLGPLAPFGLESRGYLTVVARPEKENSILEMVTGFSRRPRHVKLLVLGDYRPEEFNYHRAVLDAASDEVLFPGAIYDQEVVTALRFHSIAYLHGHTVGGTNPSLVEALGSGNPVIAHDNVYNRWVAGDAGLYFADTDSFEAALTRVLAEPGLRPQLAANACRRHREAFAWEAITDQYEQVLSRYLTSSATSAAIRSR
ncbi:DUF1972 domain-containing protein [Nocardioides speluncae]|uniref:DUF1972 domain-containing protein n=1 Tax=Nocardioides speluncae TaxID=2670337 RepID=UPI001F0CC7EE|nr:DUF1972 domain-containing protein [Nocardioides speluncae]